MSVPAEITRLNGLRNNIRTKLIALGLLSNSSADLEDCKDAITAIQLKTSSDVSIANGYVTVPAGYYAQNATIQVAYVSGTTAYIAEGTVTPNA